MPYLSTEGRSSRRYGRRATPLVSRPTPKQPHNKEKPKRKRKINRVRRRSRQPPFSPLRIVPARPPLVVCLFLFPSACFSCLTAVLSASITLSLLSLLVVSALLSVCPPSFYLYHPSPVSHRALRVGVGLGAAQEVRRVVLGLHPRGDVVPVSHPLRVVKAVRFISVVFRFTS